MLYVQEVDVESKEKKTVDMQIASAYCTDHLIPKKDCTCTLIWNLRSVCMYCTIYLKLADRNVLNRYF